MKISVQTILDVAEQTFSLKGYRGTTIQDIAKKFKVSKPAIYYYFKNKKEILKKVHAKSFEDLIARFEEVKDSDLTAKMKFIKLVKNQALVVARNADLVKIFFQDEREIPQNVIKAIKERRRRYTEQLIDLYEEGVREGSFRNIDPKVAVYIIMGACNWIYMWYSSKGELKEAELAEIVTDLLFRGFSAEYQDGDNEVKQKANKSGSPVQ